LGYILVSLVYRLAPCAGSWLLAAIHSSSQLSVAGTESFQELQRAFDERGALRYMSIRIPITRRLIRETWLGC